jgi:hypothetical protein
LGCPPEPLFHIRALKLVFLCIEDWSFSEKSSYLLSLFAFTYVFALLQFTSQKYQKHFAAITVFMPACEPIPLAPRGFNNLFFI